MLRQILSSALLVACAASCSSNKGTAEKFLDTSARIGRNACACYAEFGYMTRADCEAHDDNGIATPAQRDCIIALYEGSREMADPLFSCVLDEYRQLEDCIAPLSCTDEAGWIRCGELHGPESPAVESCIALAPSVATSLATCYE